MLQSCIQLRISCHAPAPRQPPKYRDAPPGGLKVCIVGAGAAGLFTGLILDYIQQATQNNGNFQVGYDILEAAGSDRVGGRLYTYNFQPFPDSPPGPHDYYDVGAMSFPRESDYGSVSSTNDLDEV